MRARLVSAGAFGLAALLVGFVAMVLIGGLTLATVPIALASALAFALPSSLAGAVFAPLIANRTHGLHAALGGIVITVVAAFLFGAMLSLFGLTMSFGTSVQGLLLVLAMGSGLAIVTGAITGWSVWHWLRPED